MGSKWSEMCCNNGSRFEKCSNGSVGSSKRVWDGFLSEKNSKWKKFFFMKYFIFLEINVQKLMFKFSRSQSLCRAVTGTGWPLVLIYKICLGKSVFFAKNAPRRRLTRGKASNGPCFYNIRSVVLHAPGTAWCTGGKPEVWLHRNENVKKGAWTVKWISARCRWVSISTEYNHTCYFFISVSLKSHWLVGSIWQYF